MKKRKTLLNRENAEKVKDESKKMMEAIPIEMLEQVTGAGNPFGDIPRVPTQPINPDLHNDA